MSELPPYSPAGAPPPPPAVPTNNCMAGSIQTCSIQDRQHDYFRITRDSPRSYQISLTVDSTPLYRIEMPENPSATADIQLFKAFTSDTPIAACRIIPKPAKGVKAVKGAPAANICTSSPLSASPDSWLPIHHAKSTMYRRDYSCVLPLVMVPGCAPVKRDFVWRYGTESAEADVELWLRDSIRYGPAEGLDRDQLFANYYQRGNRFFPKGVLEIRRGGGMEFEMGVVLGILAVLEMKTG